MNQCKRQTHGLISYYLTLAFVFLYPKGSSGIDDDLNKLRAALPGDTYIQAHVTSEM